MTLEHKAKALAHHAHEGQFRKDKTTPYIVHVQAVVDLLKDAGVVEESTLCAAWLHDVVEDCNISLEKIQHEFGKDIAELVHVLTRNVDRDAYKKRLQTADHRAKMVKLADTVHNCSTLHEALPEKTIRRKVEDAPFYIHLAQEVHSPFAEYIKEHVAAWL